MATQDADDFSFSDEDLDALEDTALRELEHKAILSTQQQRGGFAYGQSKTAAAARPSFIAAPDPKATSSDYGFEDEEDVINLDDQPVPLPAHSVRTGISNKHQKPNLVQRSQSRPVSTGTGPSKASQQLVPADASRNDEPRQHEQANRTSNQSHNVPFRAALPLDVSTLMARIQELERDKQSLEISFKQAQTAIQTHKGEVSIVRSKLDNSKREYELQMNRIRQLHEQQITRQKAELEQALKDRETAETSNQFSQHDAVQERVRAKNLRKPASTAIPSKTRAGQESPAVTPRKAKPPPFRDGFEDEDIVMISPSRGRDRSKPSTPSKAGNKRKRSAADQSPGMALSFSEPRSFTKPQDLQGPVVPESDAKASARVIEERKRFEFVQRFLNYCRYTAQGRRRVLESLQEFSFPSKPDMPLSSLLYEGMASISTEDPNEYSSQFFGVILSLWERCLQEKVYGPLGILLDALTYLLAYEPLKATANLTETFVPVIQATVDLVALPIGRAAANAAFVRERDSPAQLQINRDIEVSKLLALLVDIALSCTNTSEASIARFWELMQHDFILLMMMNAQSLDHSMLVLRMLSTSSLEKSIGAKVANSTSEQQTKRENLLLDRLTNLLFDTPDPPEGKDPYNDEELQNLRMEVLSVLGAFSLQHYGGEVLSCHRTLLGSLIRFLDISINALYTYSPALHPTLTNSVNISMRLIYHLVKSHPQVADLRAKIGAVHGGQHRHLVAFTRLAFSEGLLLERGIAEEVMDMAQELLESVLTPEEAEQVENVFSTSRSIV